MELFKEAYFSKSGMLIGKELKHCFDCAYCRVNNGELLDYTKWLPSDLNPNFINIPVLVNLFYGDPLLQINETIGLLNGLSLEGHKGHVTIITKGDMNIFKNAMMLVKCFHRHINQKNVFFRKNFWLFEKNVLPLHQI